MKRYEIVDFLKGYSIFTIMIFRYLGYLQLPTILDKAINFGGTGVHLFVLLSGFGLYLSFINKPLNYPMFLKKRLTKVYIPYIVVVLISAFISTLIPVFDNSIYALGGHIFLYKMFDERIIGSYGYPLWFISMILQFYFTFHVFVWLKSKLKNNAFLILGFVIYIVWATTVFLLGKESERIWYSFFLQYVWEFSLRMVIADKLSKNEKILGENYSQFVIIVIGLICSATYGILALKFGEIGKLYNDVFALTGYSLLSIFLYNLQLKPINQFFIFVGKISLSVYLLHILVLSILIALMKDLHLIYIIIISTLAIMPISFAYQKMINALYRIAKI